MKVYLDLSSLFEINKAEVTVKCISVLYRSLRFFFLDSCFSPQFVEFFKNLLLFSKPRLRHW